MKPQISAKGPKPRPNMLLGRLELYPMLVLLMPSTWRKK